MHNIWISLLAYFLMETLVEFNNDVFNRNSNSSHRGNNTLFGGANIFSWVTVYYHSHSFETTVTGISYSPPRASTGHF